MRTIGLLLSVLFTALVSQAQKTYPYTSVPGDPLEARIYTLDNGLQVWLSRNADAPRVQTNIAVRAGSKNDPGDATGLAHYLEHMLFKGTSRIGTSDWAKESALLQQISDAYERRRWSRDEGERERIYRAIDSLSTLAAAYAVPNEYDKMIKKLGARGTNAYTSTERTVYINDIPSDELERWMAIESERMQECVLRLFHTELETVYEEFNRGQDSDGRQLFQKKNELLYPLHPYGTQTTIGTGEHLKNPSMVKIHEFFKTWYVPNNMAVILAGDIDYDKTIALVDKHFGKWQRRDVPGFSFKEGPPGTGKAEVFGPESESVNLAWRFDGYTPRNAAMLKVIDGLLSNGTAGIIDLDLVQQQKVLEAYAYTNAQTDYSELNLVGKPKEGQRLDEVKDLLLAAANRLIEGDYDDWLIGAVVNDLKQQQIRYWNENNSRRAAAMTDAFIIRKDWKDEVAQFEQMAQFTKEDVTAFVGKRLSQPDVLVYKRTGENKGAHKVSKPKITAIDIKRDGMSAWRAEWEKMPSGTVAPEFIDYKKAIDRRPLSKGADLAVVKNPSNDLFSLRYIVDMGTLHDRELGVAVEYLPFLGTSRLSAIDFKKELFKLGMQLSVSTSADRCYVTLSGLESNLEKGIDLLEELLADAQPDKEALAGLLADISKQRQDAMKEKWRVLYLGLFNQARYGKRNPFNHVLNEKELAMLTPEDLVGRIKGIMAHEHAVFYYGKRPADKMAELLKKKHRLPAALKPVPPPVKFEEQPTTENRVLFVDHDMVQTEMLLVSKAGPFDVAKLPIASLFNEYFGSGLSSIVFQEIREAKALAYGANASYTTPAKKDEAHYVRAFIGTQADKLPDAVDAMLKLMNEMPEAEAQFEGAKASALKVIASTRITKESIYWNWDAANQRGLDTDTRRTTYERIPSISIRDMKSFFDNEIKGRPYTFLVIGKESAMDMKALERLGPVMKISKEQVFGYPEN
ncbi:MAG: insulinase family protein [Flavobacteriales bacterium]|nr:insulinase family protein [Flavobacteriales bacterium]